MSSTWGPAPLPLRSVARKQGSGRSRSRLGFDAAVIFAGVLCSRPLRLGGAVVAKQASTRALLRLRSLGVRSAERRIGALVRGTILGTLRGRQRLLRGRGLGGPLGRRHEKCQCRQPGEGRHAFEAKDRRPESVVTASLRRRVV